MSKITSILMSLTFCLSVFSGCLSSDDDDKNCYGVLDYPTMWCHSHMDYREAIHNGTIQYDGSSTYTVLETEINTMSKRDRYVTHLYGGVPTIFVQGDGGEIRYLDRNLPFYVNYDCIEANSRGLNGDNDPKHWSNSSGTRKITWGDGPTNPNTFWKLTVDEPGALAGYQANADCEFSVFIRDVDIRDYLEINSTESYSIDWEIEAVYYGDPRYAFCPSPFTTVTFDLDLYIEHDLTASGSTACSSDGVPQNSMGKPHHGFGIWI